MDADQAHADDRPADDAPPEPPRIWATKGIGFWALLSAVLVKAQPESILEFGGGRSTTFLADYAFRYRKRCVTVEESEVWHRKIAADLRFMNLRGEFVHHVPLAADVRPPWYDFEAVRRVVGGRPYDLVFLDGPQGAGRRNPRGQRVVERAAREARLLIVDDVHRPYNLDVFQRLAERLPADARFFHAYGRNQIAIGAAAEWRGLVADCFGFLGLAFSTSPIPAAAAPAAEGEQDE